MKQVYIYNNGFGDLLCLIDFILKNKIVPYNIKNTLYQPNLFEEIVTLKIEYDDKKVLKFKKIVGNNIFKTMYYVFCSRNDNKEIIIYYFLIHSFKFKNKIFYMRNYKSVEITLKIIKNVGNEVHRFKGFLRFKELQNGILYAEINPDNNILFLLSKHFMARLKNEYWIIKDVNRNIYSIYDKKRIYLVNSKQFQLYTNNISLSENMIIKMWCDFYKTIGIEERKNEKCRMNFMPKKYWEYIVEMRDE